ncbi:hypothetical protein PR048_030689 [Dryococelus australis]|uniref:Uncharacterized protein n=1 Tax=Dryococelus australis TaxID=614101 RepID=A0ABQ9G9P5_9NEOP|nr:hypothetical protein PR048_030689 [Dryococelus australis]
MLRELTSQWRENARKVRMWRLASAATGRFVGLKKPRQKAHGVMEQLEARQLVASVQGTEHGHGNPMEVSALVSDHVPSSSFSPQMYGGTWPWEQDQRNAMIGSWKPKMLKMVEQFFSPPQESTLKEYMVDILHTLIAVTHWHGGDIYYAHTDKNCECGATQKAKPLKRLSSQVLVARHILDDSAPIADLQENKKRIPYCQIWGNTGQQPMDKHLRPSNVRPGGLVAFSSAARQIVDLDEDSPCYYHRAVSTLVPDGSGCNYFRTLHAAHAEMMVQGLANRTILCEYASGGIPCCWLGTSDIRVILKVQTKLQDVVGLGDSYYWPTTCVHTPRTLSAYSNASIVERPISSKAATQVNDAELRSSKYRTVESIMGSPISPTLSFRRCSILTSITLIGSQDLDVKGRPNIINFCVDLKVQHALIVRSQRDRVDRSRWLRTLSAADFVIISLNSTEIFWVLPQCYEVRRLLRHLRPNIRYSGSFEDVYCGAMFRLPFSESLSLQSPVGLHSILWFPGSIVEVWIGHGIVPLLVCWYSYSLLTWAAKAGMPGRETGLIFPVDLSSTLETVYAPRDMPAIGFCPTKRFSLAIDPRVGIVIEVVNSVCWRICRDVPPSSGKIGRLSERVQVGMVSYSGKSRVVMDYNQTDTCVMSEKLSERSGGSGLVSYEEAFKTVKQETEKSGQMSKKTLIGDAPYTLPPLFKLLTSQQGELGSIPGFSHAGFVPDDATGRQGFLGISHFPPPLHSSAAPYSPRLTLIGSQDPNVKTHLNVSTPLMLSNFLFQPIVPNKVGHTTFKYCVFAENQRPVKYQASSVRKGVASLRCSSQWRNDAGSGIHSTVEFSLMANNNANFACRSRILTRRNRARRVSSGISRFLRPCIPALLHSHLTSPSSILKTLMLRAAEITTEQINTRRRNYVVVPLMWAGLFSDMSREVLGAGLVFDWLPLAARSALLAESLAGKKLASFSVPEIVNRLRHRYRLIPSLRKQWRLLVLYIGTSSPVCLCSCE